MFDIHDPNPVSAVFAIGASAMEIRDRQEIVKPEEVEELLEAAEHVDVTQFQGAPMRFGIAQALLQRTDISAWDVRLLDRIALLAAADSKQQGFFRDAEQRMNLVLAIRGARPEAAPVSWWIETSPIEGRTEVAPVAFVDNRRSLESLGYTEELWGLPWSLFTSSSSQSAGR